MIKIRNFAYKLTKGQVNTMNDRDNIIEKYSRQMMELHRRAVPEERKEEKIQPECHEVQEETEEPVTEIYEQPVDEGKGQAGEEEPVCPICGGKITLCVFTVEDAGTGEPVSGAQIMLHRQGEYLVRALTGSTGRTCAIPIFAHGIWQVSVTARDYTAVSRAHILPVPGERLHVPVKLDRSLSLSDIFTDRADSAAGAKNNGTVIVS